MDLGMQEMDSLPFIKGTVTAVILFGEDGDSTSWDAGTTKEKTRRETPKRGFPVIVRASARKTGKVVFLGAEPSLYQSPLKRLLYLLRDLEGVSKVLTTGNTHPLHWETLKMLTGLVINMQVPKEETARNLLMCAGNILKAKELGLQIMAWSTGEDDHLMRAESIMEGTGIPIRIDPKVPRKDRERLYAGYARNGMPKAPNRPFF